MADAPDPAATAPTLPLIVPDAPTLVPPGSAPSRAATARRPARLDFVGRRLWPLRREGGVCGLWIGDDDERCQRRKVVWAMSGSTYWGGYCVPHAVEEARRVTAARARGWSSHWQPDVWAIDRDGQPIQLPAGWWDDDDEIALLGLL